jgi:hypothetical protein
MRGDVMAIRVFCNKCYKEQKKYVYCRECLDGVKDDALRKQQEGIAKMVFEMLYKSRIDGDRLDEIRDAILAYGQGKEGEEEKPGSFKVKLPCACCDNKATHYCAIKGAYICDTCKVT